ncbi:hypothetical protein LRS74_20110 [Streptomyces sp. LX-29]|uniref:hypothetical protein n=1 Tax=Streptomyces sp. LX-29 TaxID=2900152 RepID=UPI00240CF5E3|nr:hypothetical protein [Streptomyces sp. LX-29]WFB09085.1 hypothetical protein LRS74_20110 [Streptomyces sp. LX-29]
MNDVTSLLNAVDRLADRLRTLPQSALTRGAAAEGRELARALAARAQAIEEPGKEPRMMPDTGLFAVGDQLAVAGHDLVEALRAAPSEVVAASLAEALERVEAAAERVR